MENQPPVLDRRKLVLSGNKPYIPAGVVAKEFSYALSHVSLLARQQKIDAVHVDKRWYVNRESVLEHRKQAEQNKITGGLKSQGIVPSPVLLLPSPTKEHLSKRANLISRTARVFVGGLLFLILSQLPIDRVPHTKSDLFDAIQNVYYGIFKTPDVGLYLNTDQIIERVRSLEEELESLRIAKPEPIQKAPSETKVIKEIVTKEIISGPSNILLTQFENRLSSIESSLVSQELLFSIQSRLSNLEIVRPALVMPSTYTGSVAPQFSIGAYELQGKKLTIEESASIGSLDVSGNTTLNTLTVNGLLSANGNIGIGTSSAPTQLTVVGSGSFSGQLKITRNPTLAHTGTWPNFTNAADATFYINPTSPVADGNIIVYANGSDTKFIVDTEGDIFARNLVLTGSTTQGTTTIAGDFSVEGSTRLGDAIGDQIKFVGTILPNTTSSNIFTIQASPSWTGDYYTRWLDSSSNPIVVIASTGNFGIGMTGPSKKLTVGGVTAVIDGGVSTNYAATGLSLGYDTGGSGAWIQAAGASGNILLQPQGNSVGIGTTSAPTRTLSVNGTIGWGDGSNELGRLTHTGVGGNPAFAASAGKGLTFYTDNASVRAIDISSTGNVGIGTTGPTTKLDISGSASVSTNFEVTGGYASISNTLYVENNGDVGIGTMNPDRNLYIKEDSGDADVILDAPSTADSAYYFARGGIIKNVIYNNGSGSDRLTFSTANGSAMYFDQSGRLSIGSTQTTPTSHLYVRANNLTPTSDTYNQMIVTPDGQAIDKGGSLALGGNTSTVDDTTIRAFAGLAGRKENGTDNNTAGYLALSTRANSGSALTEHLRITSTGNVGIGTTVPAQKVEVKGKLRVTRSDSSNYIETSVEGGAGKISVGSTGTGSFTSLKIDQFNNVTSRSVMLLDGERFGFHTTSLGYNYNFKAISTTVDIFDIASSSGTSVFHIAKSGNVGIGTTNPSGKLDVHPGGSQTAGDLLVDTANKVVYVGRLSSTAGDNTRLLVRDRLSNVYLDINTAVGNVILAPTSAAGNVGIGTTGPSAPLHVVRSGDGASLMLDQTSTIKTRLNNIATGGINNAIFGISQNLGGASFDTLDDTSRVGWEIRMDAHQSDDYLAFRHATAGANPRTVSDLMRITGAGNVGIGTTNVDAKLEVVGTASISNAFYVFSGGNVGIGATNNDEKLRVNGNIVGSGFIGISGGQLTMTAGCLSYGSTCISTVGRIEFSSGGAALNYVSTNPDAVGPAHKFNTTTAPTTQPLFQVQNVNQSKFTIASFGNVGINTASPGAMLDIKGTSSFDLFNVASASGTSILRITKGGNVGIGTTIPETKFNISVSTGTDGIMLDSVSNNSIYFSSSHANAGTRNWLAVTNFDNWGDFAVRQSTAQGGNPYSSGSTRLIINNSGNVGIGTTTPYGKLQVDGETVVTDNRFSVTGSLSYTGTGVGGEEGFYFNYDESNNRANITAFEVGTGFLPMHFIGQEFSVGTGTSTASGRFLITSAGNVGIGDEGSPDAALDIKPATTYTGPLLIIASGSNERLRVTSSGNVGIGTTTPGYKLDITTSANNDRGINILNTGAATTGYGLFSSVTGASATNVSGYFTATGATNNYGLIVDAGSVGIGTTTPTVPLHLSASAPTTDYVARLINTQGTRALGVLIQTNTASATTSDPMLQITAGSDVRFKVETGGNVGIGTTSPLTKFAVSGGMASISFNSQDGTVLRLQDSDGTCDQNPEAGGITTSCSSDARLKSNITEAPPTLSYISGIPIKEYTVNASGQRMTGVIAQELLENYSELVTMGEDGYYKVSELSSWKLIKGIQELDSQLASMSMRLEEIEKRDIDGGNVTVENSSTLSLDIIFPSILSKFSDTLEIVFEKGLIRVAKVITDILETKKLIADELQLKDEQTGEVYCVKIKNGEWDKIKGECSVEATATPAVEISGSPQPSPEASAGTAAPSPSTTPDTPTPTPTPIESPSPTPEPSADTGPEPSVEPLIQPE